MSDNHSRGSYVSQELRTWLSRAVEVGASDLHLIVGYPPVLRLHGDLTALEEPAIEAEEARAMLCSLCPRETYLRLEAQKNVDFSFDQGGTGRISRFRANVFYTGGQIGACLRVVPSAIPDFAWAGFPVALAERLA